MGLSASQGRMLLLTARKSDLEFRAQQISSRRLLLTQQLESISTEYEAVTSNRQMKISLQTTDGSETVRTNVNLTYKALMSGTANDPSKASGIGLRSEGFDTDSGFTTNASFCVVDSSGAIVISSIDQIAGYNPESKTYTQKTEKTTTNKDGSITKTIEESQAPLDESSVGKDGYIEINGTMYLLDKGLNAGGTDGYGSTNGPNYFQDCLREGKYLLKKYYPSVSSGNNGDGSIVSPAEWKYISWDATSLISDSYYTEDDEAAKAKYDREQSQIQQQDKKLELELDNIETQRSAITTEQDSIKKVMDDNIQDTFKTFA